MKSKEFRLDLWREFMAQTAYIPKEWHETMGRIAACYVEDSSFLSRIYEAVIEGERYLEDAQKEVRYKRDDDEYILWHQGKECAFVEADFKKILASMLDLLEDTLPLGSVVDLKKSAYKGVAKLESVDEIRIVITYRFLGKETQGYYFPYAGVVYPTGMLGRQEVLYFTRPLVEKVVQRSYQDEKEDAYVYLMKKELVVERGKNSYGYATKQDVGEFKRWSESSGGKEKPDAKGV